MDNVFPVDNKEKETPQSLIENHIKRNMDLYQSMAPAGFKIKFGKTFCFYLETNEIEVSPEFLIKKYTNAGLSLNDVEAETIVGVTHEINHFKEKMNLLTDHKNGGISRWQEYLEYSKRDNTYAFFDDQFSNIKMNKGVLSDTNDGYIKAIQSVYKDAFKDYDFKSNPKHIQFCQALQLDQKTGVGENIDIDDDVREIVEEVKNLEFGKNKQKLVDVITNPKTSMADRLLFQDAYIYPYVEKLKQKDKEDFENKNKSKSQDPDGNSVSDNTQEGGDSQQNSQPTDIDKEFEEFLEKIYSQIKEKQGEISWEKSDQDLIQEYEKIIGDPVSKEAEKNGISPSEFKRNRNIQNQVTQIKNPDTNRNIVEELSEIFEQIISKRLKPYKKPKYPVNLSYGDIIVDPVKIVTDVSAGEMDPKVSEIIETKEKKGNFTGKVEITVVADRSGSMTDGGKKEAQIQAIALMLESMAIFNKDLHEVASELTQTLEIDTEVMAFNGEETVELIKESSAILSEKDRAKVYGKLQTTPGSTTQDYKVLEDISKRLEKDSDKIIKINDGEIIKIVIVFTDGQSASAPSVKTIMEKLTKQKVIVCGIGISSEGNEAKNTYSPNGHLCENPTDLPVIMCKILKEHLKEI